MAGFRLTDGELRLIECVANDAGLNGDMRDAVRGIRHEAVMVGVTDLTCGALPHLADLSTQLAGLEGHVRKLRETLEPLFARAEAEARRDGVARA